MARKVAFEDTVLSQLSTVEGYWKLESDGTDESANGYDLTPVNSPTHTTGIHGNAVNLNRTNSEYYYISDGSAPNLEITGAFTWSAAFKIDSLGSNASVIIGKRDSSNVGHAIFVSNSDSKVYFRVNGFNGSWLIVGSDAISTAVEYRVTAICDPSNNQIVLWVNNSKYTAAITSGSVTDTNAALTLGCDLGGGSDTPTRFFDGIIDDVFVISEALNDTQVSVINSYVSPLPPSKNIA